MNRNDTYQEFEFNHRQSREAGSEPVRTRSTRLIVNYGWLFVWSLFITVFLVTTAILLIDPYYYEGVSAFGSLLAAAVGVTAAVIALSSLQATIQGQQEQLIQQTRIFSAEFIVELDTRFNNDMKPVRVSAAKYLLTRTPVDDSVVDQLTGLSAVFEVLGFFDLGGR
jgi:hypothetical protein